MICWLKIAPDGKQVGLPTELSLFLVEARVENKLSRRGGEYPHCILASHHVCQLGIQHLLGVCGNQLPLPLLRHELAWDQGPPGLGVWQRDIEVHQKRYQESLKPSYALTYLQGSAPQPALRSLSLSVLLLISCSPFFLLPSYPSPSNACRLPEDKSLEEVTQMFNSWLNGGKKEASAKEDGSIYAWSVEKESTTKTPPMRTKGCFMLFRFTVWVTGPASNSLLLPVQQITVIIQRGLAQSACLTRPLCVSRLSKITREGVLARVFWFRSSAVQTKEPIPLDQKTRRLSTCWGVWSAGCNLCFAIHSLQPLKSHHPFTFLRKGEEV